MLKVTNLRKVYGSGETATEAIADLSFEVSKGEFVCIVGPSGAGKTTLLKTVSGLMAPTAGEVELAGERVSGPPERMALVFQDYSRSLYPWMKVGENVAFPLRRHTDWPDAKIREVARAKLAEVGLEDDFDKMPADLSGGMRKRAGLARAMALDPDILLVDEPSAGLDPITAREIDDLLVERKKSGTTLVVVTHNIPSARHIGDELAVLHEGRVIARGTAEELDKSEDEIVRAFMKSQGGG
jgi:NitT/TauT family transport system ATP-binding protein